MLSGPLRKGLLAPVVCHSSSKEEEEERVGEARESRAPSVHMGRSFRREV